VDNCPDVANPDQTDSDWDGAGDACDVCPDDADDDADGDGVCGDVDNCPDVPNTDQTDTDGDGAGDVCDDCPFDADDDLDGDGVCGDVDNCPDVANPDQTDSDGDGAGDACDECPLDALDDVDGDGVCGDVDNCPGFPNTDQTDTDGDGAGDECDECPADPDDDADGDGVCGDVDNCPDDYNADQADMDDDGVGDVCDNCPAVPNSEQGDADGNGIGNLCEDPELEGVCTQTQGGWGARARGRNPGRIRNANFAYVFPTGLVIGVDAADLNHALFTSAQAVEDFLPAGGTPSTLAIDSIDPVDTAAGVLAGQVVALTLNTSFSEAGVLPEESPLPLGYLVIAVEGFEGLTVYGLLDLANQVIAGDLGALSPYGASVSGLNDAVTAINEAFVDCEYSENGAF